MTVPQGVVGWSAVCVVFPDHNHLLFQLGRTWFFGTVYYERASAQEKLFSGVCEQQRRRPACASAQTDQRLCYSIFGKYHI